MPVRTMRKDEVPKPVRFRTTPIKETDEWKDVQAVLSKGLKRAEAIEVSFHQDTYAELVKKGIKNPIRNLRNMIRLKVKDLKLPYDVWQQGGKDGKSIYIAGQ